MKTTIGIILTAFIILCGCSTQKDTSKDINDSVKINKKDFNEKPSHKRTARKNVTRVVLGNIEFSAPVADMGFVTAKDAASGNMRVIAIINPDNIKTVKTIKKVGVKKEMWVGEGDDRV